MEGDMPDGALSFWLPEESGLDFGAFVAGLELPGSRGKENSLYKGR
jgi:hypothetical protein